MKPSRAFTLLEMLVVLVIVGLLSLVLMQIFSQGLMIRSRMSDRIQTLHTEQVQEQWFRRLVFGLYRFQTEDPRVLKGDGAGFEGVTLMAVDRAPGELTPIKISIERQSDVSRLLYQVKGAAAFALLAWRGEGQLRYLDKKGEWLERWPRVQRDAEEQLPQGIMLSGRRDGRPFVWFATIPIQKEAYFPPPEGE